MENKNDEDAEDDAVEDEAEAKQDEEDEDEDGRPKCFYKTMNMQWNIASWAARRKYCRCTMGLDQYVASHIFSILKLKLPEKSYTHGFNCSSIGNCLNDIDLPNIEHDTNLFR